MSARCVGFKLLSIVSQEVIVIESNMLMNKLHFGKEMPLQHVGKPLEAHDQYINSDILCVILLVSSLNALAVRNYDR